MWTIVDGNKGTILLQSPVGREIVHVHSLLVLHVTRLLRYASSPLSLIQQIARPSRCVILQDFQSTLTPSKSLFHCLPEHWLALMWQSASQRHGSKILCTLQQLRLSTPLQLQILPLSIAQTMEASWISEQRLRDKQESVFSNGSECDEWGYFRGECSPSSAGTNSTTTNSTAPRHLTVELNETVGIKAKSWKTRIWFFKKIYSCLLSTLLGLFAQKRG